MNDWTYRRREFVRLSLLAGILGLSGCAIRPDKRLLRASKGVLPKELLNQLPSPWRFQYLASDFFLGTDEIAFKKEPIDLLALEDGWLRSIPVQELLPIDVKNLSPKFNNHAREFLKLFGDNLQTKVLPFAVSPWVMVFRNGKPWLKKARESWDVLLEPSLKGKIVLPNSPRLIISIVDQIGEEQNLEKFISNAKTFDDRNALNWLLSGKAQVAVLPLSRCIGSLVRDPRLSVVLPSMGSPLNWTLLVRPKSSRNDLPLSWLENSWDLPLLGKLLSQGWMAPLMYSELLKCKDFIRNDLETVLLPEESVWEKCWSLFPLTDSEQMNLENRWNSFI